MKVESFLKVVEEIEDSYLPVEHQEEMIKKIADLSRFIQSFDPSIEIINWMRYKFTIINHSGTNKGIIFCDHTDRSSESAYYFNASLAEIKKLEQLKELWLVLIIDSASQELKLFRDIIENKSPDNIYDKIFSLDFLRSEVQIIK
ncbi:hypothetical protein [Chryseobacterium echinoideorum]|uniref:hypothetical protein n=1 Tax=Chryseobacterium echinoideorum TaxID=1549648 RepID=UPI001186F4FD|nr:hypothetical protein [Chryseobacterium echinoideorum]